MLLSFLQFRKQWKWLPSVQTINQKLIKIFYFEYLLWALLFIFIWIWIRKKAYQRPKYHESPTKHYQIDSIYMVQWLEREKFINSIKNLTMKSIHAHQFRLYCQHWAVEIDKRLNVIKYLYKKNINNKRTIYLCFTSKLLAMSIERSQL